MNRKSQSSLEFVIMVGFLLVFFSVFLLIIQENMSAKIDQKQNRMVNELAIEVQDEINLALEASDGYSRDFSVPGKIANKDYNITLLEGSVYLYTTDGKHAVSLPIPQVKGDIKKGSNNIRKESGEILVNQ
jgi:hypothetical protein